MADETELIQKREELKRRIAAGEYKWLIEVVLTGVGRFVQKMTRNAKPLPLWYSAAVIALVILLIGFLTSLLLGEFYPVRRNQIQADIAVVLLALLGVTFGNMYKGVILTTLRDNIVDAIGSVDDLVDLQAWLVHFNNLRTPFLFSLAFSIFVGFNGIYISTITGAFIGWGSLILGMLVGFEAGLLIFYFFPLLALPARLSRYQFNLYGSDPSSSEVIDHISDMFGNFVYIAAGLSAVATLIFAFLGVLGSTVNLIILVLISWVPLTALFLTNQYAIAKIIVRAKWKTLNEIQTEVEQLRAGGQLAEKETMEAVNRLMDYHDRIRNTRNSALNVRASLSFVNSLLLPVLAFLLANLDKVFELF